MFHAGAGFAVAATTLGLSSNLIRKHKEHFDAAAKEAQRDHLHLLAHIQHELQFKMSGSFDGDDRWADSHKRFTTAAAKVLMK